MKTRTLFATASYSLLSSCRGFIPPMQSSLLASSLASSLRNNPAPDEIRQDIEQMRKEALERLEALEIQMEELQQHQKEVAEQASKAAKPEEEELPESESSTAFFEEPTEELHSTDAGDITGDVIHAPMDLISGTRWRVAFDVGRESGTWMPATWGATGDRIRFQTIIDFTAEEQDTSDEFFLTSVSPTKICNVVEGFVVPSGVGKSSIGRQMLPVKASGLYQIARGQGPSGTDILRFFIVLEENVTFHDHDSDVYVPAGPLYGTCGYFSASPHSHAIKEKLNKHYHGLLLQQEELQRQLDNDVRIFSIDHMRRLKNQWELHKRVEKAASDLHRARQKDPERSLLRVSRNGDVALTKEGGVFCKVVKGVSVEYRILGRMEVGCMEKRDDNDTSKLHP